MIRAGISPLCQFSAEVSSEMTARVRDRGRSFSILALDATSKARLAHRTGKRDWNNTHLFCADLRERVLGAPEISADAFRAYPRAIEQTFGANVHFGVIDKDYAVEAVQEAARRYSPGAVVAVKRKVVIGVPLTI